MLTLDFADPRAADVRLVGGKAHGLALMVGHGIPVPPGFSVSTCAYRDYLSVTGLGPRLEALLGAVDRTSIGALEDAAVVISGWFEEVPIPQRLRDALDGGYRRLCDAVGLPDVSVAVRSSATAEDASGTSFAGEYETYVGLRGLMSVELHLRRCWASAFSARALSYAWKNGISPLVVEMAVVIQKTVNARAAGVMFTVSPVSGDRSRAVIEASYGLGLGVVGGEITPDRYVVAKIEGTVVDRVVGGKHIEYLDGQQATPVDAARAARLCLDDQEVLALVQIGKRLERLHGAPQDIEFAIDRELPPGRNIVLLQCRPITALPSRSTSAEGPRHPLSTLAAGVLAAANPCRAAPNGDGSQRATGAGR